MTFKLLIVYQKMVLKLRDELYQNIESLYQFHHRTKERKNRMNISVNLYLYDSGQNLISSKTFNENFEYNISDNKLNLREYEKNIKLNLVDEITQQILIFLASS